MAGFSMAKCERCGQREQTGRGLCRPCHAGELPPKKPPGRKSLYTEDERRRRQQYRQQWRARVESGSVEGPPDYQTPIPPRQRPPRDPASLTVKEWEKRIYNQWYVDNQAALAKGKPAIPQPDHKIEAKAQYERYHK